MAFRNRSLRRHERGLDSWDKCGSAFHILCGLSWHRAADHNIEKNDELLIEMSKRSSPAAKDEPVPPKRLRQTLLSSALVPAIPTLPHTATVSAPIEDRKSRFKGYFIPCRSLKDLAHYRSLLHSLPELADADHRIMAWNVDKSTGFDDDGEKWAGRRVLDILCADNDEGLLCVARWYGGILLGPARFDHIEHVAADAVATYHLSQGRSPEISSPTIAAPRILDGGEKDRLIRTLRNKDMSVESLRNTIAAKKRETGQESPHTSPCKEMNYERMQVEALKRLVIARDATIKSLRDIYREITQTLASEDTRMAQQVARTKHGVYEDIFSGKE